MKHISLCPALGYLTSGRSAIITPLQALAKSRGRLLRTKKENEDKAKQAKQSKAAKQGAKICAPLITLTPLTPSATLRPWKYAP